MVPAASNANTPPISKMTRHKATTHRTYMRILHSAAHSLLHPKMPSQEVDGPRRRATVQPLACRNDFAGNLEGVHLFLERLAEQGMVNADPLVGDLGVNRVVVEEQDGRGILRDVRDRRAFLEQLVLLGGQIVELVGVEVE